jgi:hypothetical protein
MIQVELVRAWTHFQLARRVIQGVDRGDFTVKQSAAALGVSFEDQPS